MIKTFLRKSRSPQSKEFKKLLVMTEPAHTCILQAKLYSKCGNYFEYGLFLLFDPGSGGI